MVKKLKEGHIKKGGSGTQPKIEKPKMKKQKCWYRQYMGECPVCGKDKSYKERVNGTKPKDSTKIYVQLSQAECFDNCI